jgi:hypothetical protein
MVIASTQCSTEDVARMSAKGLTLLGPAFVCTSHGPNTVMFVHLCSPITHSRFGIFVTLVLRKQWCGLSLCLKVKDVLKI